MTEHLKQQEYLEELTGLEKISKHSDFSKEATIKSGVKKKKLANNDNDNTNKWYKHNPESGQENETHRKVCDFEIQTD